MNIAFLCLCFFFFFFFFQAEDGIRVLVRSRGLGMCIRDRKKILGVCGAKSKVPNQWTPGNGLGGGRISQDGTFNGLTAVPDQR